MQNLNIKSIFIRVKGHASTNQGLATPLLHAVLFKVALHSSHANLFTNRLDKENRLATLFAKTLSERDSFALGGLKLTVHN